MAHTESEEFSSVSMLPNCVTRGVEIFNATRAPALSKLYPTYSDVFPTTLHYGWSPLYTRKSDFAPGPLAGHCVQDEYSDISKRLKGEFSVAVEWLWHAIKYARVYDRAPLWNKRCLTVRFQFHFGG